MFFVVFSYMFFCIRFSSFIKQYYRVPLPFDKPDID